MVMRRVVVTGSGLPARRIKMYKVRREKNIRNRASNSRSFVLSGVHMGMFGVASRKETVGRFETGEVES